MASLPDDFFATKHAKILWVFDRFPQAASSRLLKFSLN
jgi:hypothetical protein